MAFGYKCKHCGREEIAHEGGHSETAEETKRRFPGRRSSLKTCPGFELSKVWHREERCDVLDIKQKVGVTGLSTFLLKRHHQVLLAAS